VKVSDIDDLIESQERMRIRMVAQVGQARYIALDDDPDAMVREVLRLALIGAKIEAATARQVGDRLILNSLEELRAAE